MSTELPRAALLPFLLATASGALAPAADVAPGAHHATDAQALQFGPYRLVRELGRGSMGVVYLAQERAHQGRSVALKVAHAAPDSKELRAQLEFESEALAAVRHDHVVRLFDAGTTPDGHPWLAMEYVAGEPIDVYCARRDLPLEERVRLCATVGHAVQHLHQRGVVHRDLKPSNILVTEIDGAPVPKIIDLGFAALSGKDLDREGGVVAGTPAYMAPELFTAVPTSPDPRSDVFALGVVLHELVVGTTPGAPAARGDEIVIAADHGAATPPSTHLARNHSRRVRSLFAHGLDAAMLAAVARDPRKRLGDAGALAVALEGALARGRTRSRLQRWLWRSVLGVAVCLLG